MSWSGLKIVNSLYPKLFWGNVKNSVYIFNNFLTLRCLQVLHHGRQGPGILCCQFHGCWWPGNSRSQGISSNGIGWVFYEIVQSQHPKGVTIMTTVILKSFARFSMNFVCRIMWSTSRWVSARKKALMHWSCIFLVLKPIKVMSIYEFLLVRNMSPWHERPELDQNWTAALSGGPITVRFWHAYRFTLKSS